MNCLIAVLRRGIARGSILSLVLAGVAMTASPAPVLACWGEYPRAEKAFKEGIEAFTEGDFASAIERFREARDARREPDGSCTVQLYGRGPASKAYYLPYYYLAKSFYEGKEGLEGAELGCQDAVHYISLSMKWRGETYDVYRRRFREQLSEMDNVLESCGGSVQADIGEGWAGRRFAAPGSEAAL